MSWAEKWLFNVNSRKRWFEIAYCIFLFETILQYSKYGEMGAIHLLFPALRILSYSILLIKLLLDFLTKEFSLEETIIITVVGILLVISAYVTKDKNLLIYWAFIVGANNTNFERLIKISLFVHIVTIAFVVLSCYGGVLENRIYYRNVTEQTGKRESLGFEYTTEIINQVFYMVLMWIYIRKDKIKPIEWIAMAGLVLALYIKTDTKNATALAIAAIIGSIVLKYSTSVRKFHKWYAVVAIGIFPAVACFIIWASYSYSEANALWVKLNQHISGRLALGKSGILNYGILPFGQPIVWVGGTPENGAVYNYVDSSYVQILLNYGPIILSMILAGAVSAGLTLSKKKDMYLFLVLCIIAVHTTFDPQLMWIGYNTFVMLYSYFKSKEESSRDESAEDRK